MAASFDLGSLKIGINVDNTQAKQGLSEVDKAVANTEKQGNSKFASFAKGAAQVGLGIAAAGAAAITGLAAVVKKTADTAGTIKDASDRMKISAEDFQELEYASRMSGVSMSDMEAAAKKLAASGSNLTFDEAIMQLAGITDESERAAKATELFGKGAYNLTPLLNEGVKGIEALRKEARDTGQVMSNDAVSSAEGFGDSLEKLQGSIAGMGAKIGTALMPMAQKLVDMLQNYLPKLQPLIDIIITSGMDMLENLLPPIIEIVQQLLPVLIPVITQIFAALQPLIPVILQLVEAFLPLITAVLTPLLPLLTPIIAAFAEILTAVIPPLNEVINVLARDVLPPLIDIFVKLVELALKNVIDIFNNFKPVIDNVIEHIRLMVQFFQQIFSGDFKGAFETMKSIGQNALDALGNIFTGAVNSIKSIFSNVYETFKEPLDKAWQWVQNTWSKVTEFLTRPITNARDTISKIVSTIKGFFENLKLPEFKLPKIKLPHFKITGSFSLNPPSIPRLSVDWYRNGAIFAANKPQIIGVGDNPTSPEAVVPLDKLQGFIDNAMAKNGTGISITGNTFNIRDDTDIQKIAAELFKLQQKAQRARGY